jgi:myotubularin-related protein 1/2
MTQFPHSFEFSEQLLVFLGDHVHSCLFGTFLGNYEKMRAELEVKEKTVSIWSYVFEFKEEFLNHQYTPFLAPIWPCCSIAKIRIWDRFYLRWDPGAHPSSLSGLEWHDNW